jgi:hypothetical protein
LFGIVVILLVANIIITKYVTNDEQPKIGGLSGIEIDKSFHSALKNYGFSDIWISKKKIKNISVIRFFKLLC